MFYFISIINKIKSVIYSFRKLKWKKWYISDIENRTVNRLRPSQVINHNNINIMTETVNASTPIEDRVDIIKKEIGKATDRFDNFLTFAGLQKKEYQTEGIQFCLKNELASDSLPYQVRGGIVADEMGLGKTIMMIGLILANFQKRTLVVLPVALVKQWEQQILKNTGHQALVFYGAEKKKITQEMLENAPVVITTYGHMVRRSFVAAISHKDVSKSTHALSGTHARENRLYGVKWGRVIFDEAHHLKGRNTQIFRSVSSLNADIRWFVTGTPIQNSIHDLYSLCALLGLPAAYYANNDNIRAVVKTFVLKRTKQSVGLSLPPLTTKNIVVQWSNPAEMILARNLHSGIGCLNIPGGVGGVDSDPALPAAEAQDMSWFPEPSPVKIGRMIQAKQSCIYPRLACRKSVPQMPPCEDENYSSKISKVVRTVLSRKDNGKRKIVFCHFRGEIDYIQSRITTAFPSMVVRYLDGRTKESERRQILAPDAAIDVLILQIQTCCEGLNLQQFSEVYFVSPDWNPSVEDQAIARCHRFGQTEPVVVFRFVMAPFKIPATLETQHLLDAQRERDQQQYAVLSAQQDAYNGAYADIASQNSQASTADPYNSEGEDDGEGDGDNINLNLGEDNGCIDFDTIETYTANIQNKKRIFADEILRV
jgi:SNF2 family DNA or RNA helicase